MTVLCVPDLTSSLLLGVDFWRRFHLRPDIVEETCEVNAVTHRGTNQEEDEEGSDSILNREQLAELAEIIEEYRPLLDKGKIGCAKGVLHHINTGNASPIKQSYNSLNPKLLVEAHKELDRRLAENIVEPSDSPWCSPLLMLKKPDGEWHWVVDFRKLRKYDIRGMYHFRSSVPFWEQQSPSY